VARTWPFERKGEPREPWRAPEDFRARQGPETEAVVVRIGLNGAQLVLVDGDGAWERWVYPSEDDAVAAAERLGIAVHHGYPEHVRVRMNARVRPLEEFELAPYPEQGRVGPVNSYPENRPRRVAPAPPPADEEASEEFLKRHPGLAP
jgi:hypothetical protein